MNSNINQCSECNERYDHSDHTPMALPQCGHTFCLRCCQNVFQNASLTPSCPSCQKPFIQQNGRYLEPQRNIYALNNLEKPDPFPNCLEHDLPKMYYCCQDNQCVCSDCYFTYHNGHQKENLAKYTEQINERLSNLQKSLRNCEFFESELIKQVDLKKDKTLEIADFFFQEMEKKLQINKQLMKFKLIAMFEQEKERLHNKLYGSPSLTETLQEKISNCKQLNNLNTILDQETNDLIWKCSIQQLKDNAENLTNELDSTLSEFAQKLDMKYREFNFEEFANNTLMKSNNHQADQSTALLELSYSHGMPFRTRSYLNFVVDGNTLHITLGPELNLNCFIDIEAWKQVLILNFTFESFELLKGDIVLLRQIISEINQLRIINICDSNQLKRYINNMRLSLWRENLDSFLETIFLRPENLEGLGIFWENETGNDVTLNFIVDYVLPKALEIKKFEIKAGETNISNLTTKRLIGNLNLCLQKLEYFTFLAKGLEGIISDQKLILPQLRDFTFVIYNQSHTRFLQASLESMRYLERLCFSFKSFRLDDPEISSIFSFLPNMRSLKRLEAVVSGLFKDILGSNNAQANVDLLAWLKVAIGPISNMPWLEHLTIGTDFRQNFYNFDTPYKIKEFIINCVGRIN